RSEVVAPRLDEDEVELREATVEPRDRLEVDRGVLADRGVRAAAGLHADDALGRERFVPHQELRVLLGVDVVRDDGERVPIAKRPAERERQGGLAGADRSTDPHPQGRSVLHDLKILVYWVSCRAESSASPGARLPRASSGSPAARRTIPSMRSASASSRR